YNATPAALAALACFGANIAITVAMSSRAQHIEDVRAQLPAGGHLVLDSDMRQLMTEADLAVGAAGASAFERAVLGLPSIIVIAAENQRGLADLLIDAGAATYCGYLNSGMKNRLSNAARVLVGNGQARFRMSRAASNLIDGQGGARIHKDFLEMDRIHSV
ncbi:MAG: glycosyltransferase, partial [Candidatus Binatia bacterium]